MAMSTEAELQRQKERLELLLNLTTKITSSLNLREVLRAVAANIREVIHADAVVVSLPDIASGKSRVIAVDFPHGKGAVKEEVTVTLNPANKKAIDTLKPVVICTRERAELTAEAYEIVATEGIKAICLIPLVNRGRVLGTLSISRTTETPFVPEDVDIGDVALNEGKPAIHAHAVIGKRDGTAYGGHLVEAHIRPTCEVVLTESPAHLQKFVDPESGLALSRL
jgi:transcriptional regulator with GAF, ATPase, and Fis domain